MNYNINTILAVIQSINLYFLADLYHFYNSSFLIDDFSLFNI